MRSKVKEMLSEIQVYETIIMPKPFVKPNGIIVDTPICEVVYKNNLEAEILDMITNELKWLDHKTEYISKLEEQVDELEIENFDLKERIEQLEGKYETEGYDDSRY